jgi:hypothetical protein
MKEERERERKKKKEEKVLNDNIIGELLKATV